MNFTKKFDRAFQWAGEKMGGEAKTSMSEDFKMLETEMSLRHDGMDRLQKSMTAYIKWLGRRGETFEDKEKGLPISYLGRTMTSHGEDFESDSEFGTCLIVLGRANERLAAAQERFVADATSAWLESLDRSLAMMKEYQSSRKKLENRRLAYDASMTKMQKARRDDFRIEEEVRTNRAKYEESSEDVLRRMQDIKDAEADSIHDLSSFLDIELEYHERCVEELRRVKRTWPGAATAAAISAGGGPGGLGGGRSRSNTARSYGERHIQPQQQQSHVLSPYDDELDPQPVPVRMPIRSNTRVGTSSSTTSNGNGNGTGPDKPSRPSVSRTSTYQGSTVRSGTSTPTSSHAAVTAAAASSASASTVSISSLRNGLRPINRSTTNGSYGSNSGGGGNVFADDADDTASGGSATSSGSPDWADHRSTSPATSYNGSLNRSTSNVTVGNGASLGTRKPPPPPPNRAKKPPPPPPAKREVGY